MNCVYPTTKLFIEYNKQTKTTLWSLMSFHHPILISILNIAFSLANYSLCILCNIFTINIKKIIPIKKPARKSQIFKKKSLFSSGKLLTSYLIIICFCV